MPPPVKGSLLDAGLRRDLAALYDASDRHYHSMSHVEDLLRLAERHADLIDNAAEMEAAIWFHDAIFDTHRNDNEARSADLARDWLGHRVGEDSIGRIALMIEATASHVLPQDVSGDLRTRIALFLDMDLSILGAEPERFDAYEADVRKEYGWVPQAAWREGRAKVLARFLERPAIFVTTRFRDLFEARARANLARSLARLNDPA